MEADRKIELEEKIARDLTKQETIKKGSYKKKKKDSIAERKDSVFALNQSIFGGKDTPRIFSNNYLLNKNGVTMNSLPTNNYKKDTEGMLINT